MLRHYRDLLLYGHRPCTMLLPALLRPPRARVSAAFAQMISLFTIKLRSDCQGEEAKEHAESKTQEEEETRQLPADAECCGTALVWRQPSCS